MARLWSETKTLQSAAAATGNGTAYDCTGMAAVGFQVSGTFTATVTFEGTLDGTNWVGLQAINVADGSLNATATAAGLFVASCAGLTLVRARVTWTSGTSVTVVASATAAPLSLPYDGVLGANSGVDIGDVTLTAGTATIGGTTDAGPAWTSVLGVSSACVTSADATGNPAVTGAPTSGQKLVITDIIYSSDTAMNLTFSEETSGTVLFKVFVPANGAGQITPRSKVKLATADKKLMCDASASGNIAVTVLYYSEA